MKRVANLTNDKAVKALKWTDGNPIQFAVKDKNNPGYYIRLSSGGTKTWYYQYKLKGNLRRLWFGRYPGITCADAFSRYDEARKKVGLGIDVVALAKERIESKRSQEARDSFTLSVLFHDHYFPRYAKPKKRTWRNDWIYFTTKIEPTLGSKAATSLTPNDVERLIRPMEVRGYNTARLTLAVLRKMYNWALLPNSAKNTGDGALLTVLNPCRLYRLDKSNVPEPIIRILSNREIRDLWSNLTESSPDRIIRLQLLTGCRVSEVAGIRECELDREAREWNLPVSRTKTKRPLNVPLTDRMLTIIGPLVEDFVFPATSKAGHTTVSAVIQSLKRHCTALGIKNVGTHTMRRTFITQLARLGVTIEIRNRLTNHKDPSMDAVYNQHDYLLERSAALEKWDRKLAVILQAKSVDSNIVVLSRAPK